MIKITFLRKHVHGLYAIETTMEIIPSNRGGQKLLFEGYMYTKQHERLSGTRWKCVERDGKCPGAVRTNGIVGAPVVLGEHNHLPSEEKINVTKARESMKRIAQNGVGKPDQIYNRVAANLNNTERLVLPDIETCKRSIRRSLSSNEPVQPATLQNLIVAPAEWTLTRGPTPRRFLLYDNGVNAHRRIIMFGTDECLDTLCDSSDVFMDGTFKTAPKLFMQLYVIHRCLGDTTVPLVLHVLREKGHGDILGISDRTCTTVHCAELGVFAALYAH